MRTVHSEAGAADGQDAWRAARVIRENVALALGLKLIFLAAAATGAPG